MVISFEHAKTVPATVRSVYLPVNPRFGSATARINFSLDRVPGILLAVVHDDSSRGRVPGCP